MSVRWAFNFGSWKPNPSEILLATSCIQPEEKKRIAKFVFKKDFKSSLVGRLMIRKFIASATNLPYNDIKIVRDEKEKPIFVWDKPEKIDFNVSHHGNYTVLSGEVNGTSLGVDVMQIGYSGGKTLSEYFRLMNRQFSPDEWQCIKNSGDENEQITTFCRNWSLKESYVKAIGVGITVNLQEISFKIKTPNISVDKIITDTELFVRGEKMPWVFEEILLDDKHCVATALYNINGLDHHKPVNFTHLSVDDLLSGVIPLLEPDEEYRNDFFTKKE